MATLDRDQAGVDELADVVRQRRLRDVEQGHELALADLFLATAKHVEDMNTQRLSQRLGDNRDALSVERAVKTA